jgi:hypothetical protein
MELIEYQSIAARKQNLRCWELEREENGVGLDVDLQAPYELNNASGVSIQRQVSVITDFENIMYPNERE